MSVKISELPILDSLADNDIVAGVDVSGNVTSKIEMSTLKNYIDTNTQYTAGTNIDITNNVVSAPNVYNKTETDGLIDDLETNINEQLEEKDEQIEELQSEVDSLSTIFNAFPTESGEGESVTLDDTAEVKFKNFNLKGNTSQTTYSGKNKLDLTGITTRTLQSGVTITPNFKNGLLQSIKISGTPTITAWQALKRITLPAGSYIMTGINISQTSKTGLRVGVYIDSARQYFINANSTSYSFTLEEETSMDYVVWVQNVDYYPTGDVYITPMIRLSSVSDDTYEPYVGGTPSPNPSYPQPVNVVSGDNDIVVCGKNLLKNQYLPIPNSDTSSNYTVNNAYLPQGTYTLATTDNSKFGNTIYMKLFNEDKQLIKESGHIDSSGIGFSATTYNYFVASANNLTYIQFTLDDNYYVRIGLLNSDNTKEVMLVKGTEIIRTYEPYQGNTYNIDLPVENLFNKDNANYVNGWIDGTAMRLNTINGNRMFYMPCKPNTTYTISRSIITSSFRTATYDSTPFPTVTGSNVDYTVSSVLKNDSGTTLTITTGANAKYLVVHYGKIEDTNLNETLATIQVEYGSKANSYSEYGTTPIELCKIGNYQDYFGKSDGRNLCNATFELGGIDTTTGQNGSGTDRVRTKDYVEVKPNTTYTLSGVQGSRVVCFYNSSKAYLSYAVAGSQATSGTFTTPSNTSYIRWYIIQTNTNIYEMLNEGSSALPYEPYGKVWYLHKEIGKVVLNGSESVWAKSGASTESVFVASLGLNYENVTSKGGTRDQWLTDYFHLGTLGTENTFLAYNEDTTWGYRNLGFSISTSLVNDIGTWKTWLSNNNISVYYPLQTPTTTEITYQPLIDQLNLLEKAMSKDGQTNISQVSNDKPFILDVTAIKSLQNILDRIELLES